MRRLELTSVNWTVREALAVFLFGWIGIPVVVILLLQYFAGISPIIQNFLQDLSSEGVVASFVLVMINAIAALGMIGFYLKKHRRGLASLGLRNFNWLRAAGWIGFGLIAFRIIVAFAYLVADKLITSFNPMQEQSNEFTQAANQYYWVSFAALVIIPPLIEELVFRGYLFPALAKRWGVVVGAVLSSLLFGLAHFQLNVTIYTLILGVLLCIMYYRLGSLWPSIIFHAINNYLAFVVLSK